MNIKNVSVEVIEEAGLGCATLIEIECSTCPETAMAAITVPTQSAIEDLKLQFEMDQGWRISPVRNTCLHCMSYKEELDDDDE